MTGPEHPVPPPDDALAAARARAAELGVSVSEYVREALWRARGEEAWQRALAQARAESAAREESAAGERG